MSKPISLIIGLFEALRTLFSRSAPPDPLAPTEEARAPTPDDIEILGLFRHYSAPEPEECIPYNDIDPNRYPDVWVVGREVVPDTHYLIGLEVDGYIVPLEDVQSVHGPEHSDDLRIAIIRYPRYDRYRRPGVHQVNVLIGRPDATERGVEWIRKIPYEVRTVVRR
ncbi:hypothetical protein [Methanoculleus sp. UBA312]|uniref:hypothetical protein n=1 Tax=Methanoculleus sp. UBA312 TaxID=1915499 RepID=UPI0031BA51FE